MKIMESPKKYGCLQRRYGVSNEFCVVSNANLGVCDEILGSWWKAGAFNDNLGVSIEILWYPMKIRKSPTKIWGLQWKVWGLRRKYGVSNENIGVSNENLGFSSENMGVPKENLGSLMNWF